MTFTMFQRKIGWGRQSRIGLISGLALFGSLLLLPGGCGGSLAGVETTAPGKELPAVPSSAAVLSGPYEDIMQQEIRFGRRSYYLTPWRSYMDTRPSSQFLNCLGVNFNVRGKEADATAAVLGEAGFRSARVEVGWGNFDYNHPERLLLHREKELIHVLQVLKQHGIRPLILLNANAGWPCPAKGFRGKLTKDAPEGTREIFLERTDAIVPHRTGLKGQAYQCAFPLIVNVDKKTGRCELSAPLRKSSQAGKVQLVTLRYAPFGGKTKADGTPNHDAEETLHGWMLYVAEVCRAAQQALGTAGTPDAGFDLEVWNEYTFGSQFLQDKNYYSPAPKYKEPISYSGFGVTRTGHEILLPMTVDYVNNPTNGLPGVKVISGFANQRPWDNGVGMWPGQTGFSRHYYSGSDIRAIAPGKLDDRSAKSGPVNALGLPDGQPDGKDWHTVVPGTFFVPTIDVSMPEWWLFGYKTEFITRDIQPFPGPWEKHYRYGHPGTGQAAEVWMTEANYWRNPFAQDLTELAKCTKDDPRLRKLMQHLGAKAMLRMFTMYSHKGVKTITLFAAKDHDWSFGFLSDDFFTALKAADLKLTDDVRAKAGEQAVVLKRVSDLMKEGQALPSTGKLTVERLVEHDPQVVFKGDGTAEHPNRYHRDDFACLPFQLTPGKYAVAYYVVTRNLRKSWRPELDVLDPRRYDMPPQVFDLTLGNIRGEGAKVSVFDPVTDRVTEPKALAASERMLTVQIPTVDYPRFLIVEESQPSPIVQNPELFYRADGSAKLKFSTNIPTTATVTWGLLPKRSSAGSVVLKESTEHTVDIKQLDVDCGIQIEVKAHGLVCRLPQWGFNPAGARWAANIDEGMAQTNQWHQLVPLNGFKISDKRKNASVAIERRLPPFAKGTAAREYSCSPLPKGLKWQGSPGNQWCIFGKGDRTLRFDLRLEPDADLDNAISVLPETSTTDRFVVRKDEWSGFPAIRVDIRFDATAHPGEKALYQAYYLVPCGNGLLVLSAKGGKKAFNWQFINSVAKSVKLRK